MPALLAQQLLHASNRVVCDGALSRCWCSTVGIGFWRTVSTWQRISFRYVRVTALGTYINRRPGPTQRVSFVRTQVVLVLSALLKAVVRLAPLKVVAVGLRATLLKLQAVDLGRWRRQAALHLRRRLADIAETKSTDNGALFHYGFTAVTCYGLRHRHLGARRLGPLRDGQSTCVTRLLTRKN